MTRAQIGALLDGWEEGRGRVRIEVVAARLGLRDVLDALPDEAREVLHLYLKAYTATDAANDVVDGLSKAIDSLQRALARKHALLQVAIDGQLRRHEKADHHYKRLMGLFPDDGDT